MFGTTGLHFKNTRETMSHLGPHIRNTAGVIEVSAGNSSGRTRKCHEYLGLMFSIDDWSDRAEMMQENGLSVVFAEADFNDRMGAEPVNPGKAVQFDEIGVLKNWLKPDGTLTYTYSERMYYQLPLIIQLLKEHPSTRQAFMSIWNPTEDSPNFEKDRVPCSIGFHFLIREERLSLIYYMRSLEVTKCLGNDIYTSSRMLETVAQRVGVLPGKLIFSIGSAHVFEE